MKLLLLTTLLTASTFSNISILAASCEVRDGYTGLFTKGRWFPPGFHSPKEPRVLHRGGAHGGRLLLLDRQVKTAGHSENAD